MRGLPKIDVKKLKCKTAGERKFFETLLKKKKVVYKWHETIISVLDDENKAGGSRYHEMCDDDFFSFLGTHGVTSADAILILLFNEVEVDIVNASRTFKKEGDMEEFMNRMREMVRIYKKREEVEK